MNLQSLLKKSRIKALLALHEAIRRDHPEDPIRAFGIFACNEGDGIEPFYHLQSHLEQRAVKEGVDSQSEYFAPDYEATQKYASLFHNATECYLGICEKSDDEADLDDLHADLYAVMLDSIRAVERTGIFGKGNHEIFHMENWFYGVRALERWRSPLSGMAATGPERSRHT